MKDGTDFKIINLDIFFSILDLDDKNEIVADERTFLIVKHLLKGRVQAAIEFLKDDSYRRSESFILVLLLDSISYSMACLWAESYKAIEELIQSDVIADEGLKRYLIFQSYFVGRYINFDNRKKYLNLLHHLKADDILFKRLMMIESCYSENPSYPDHLVSEIVSATYHYPVFFQEAMFDVIECSINFDRVETAKEVIGKLRKSRTFYIKEKFKYYEFCINYLKNLAFKYNYPYQFQEIPIIYKKMKIIECYYFDRASDLDQACDELFKDSQGSYTKSDIENSGDIVFKKLVHDILSKRENRNGVLHENELVSYILKKGKVSKEELYYSIYNRYPLDKKDMGKMSSVLKRIKQKYFVNIRLYRGFYHID